MSDETPESSMQDSLTVNSEKLAVLYPPCTNCGYEYCREVHGIYIN